MTVFQRIKEISIQKKMSLQEIAQKAGMGINTIYGWQKQDPATSKLTRVAEVLNVSVDYLLGNTDDPHKQKNVDLNDDDLILSFDGKPIPDEDKELIRRLLRGK